MRVIAGSAGGLPLLSPRTDLRPTMDMVKGAIFSSLGEMIAGSRVLDLFAGTGALGIEALSRGAASATFVESDRRAVAIIEKNLDRTHLAGASSVVAGVDVFRFLDRMPLDQRFDLIFADPPYAKSAEDREFSSELLGSTALHSALAADGLFILEHLPTKKLTLPARWSLVRDKRYGATSVAFLRKAETVGAEV